MGTVRCCADNTPGSISAARDFASTHIMQAVTMSTDLKTFSSWLGKVKLVCKIVLAADGRVGSLTKGSILLRRAFSIASSP